MHSVIWGVKTSRVAFALAFVSLLAVASADNVTKQLEASYSAMSTAFQHKDVKAISNFFGPTFSAHLENGQSADRAKVIEGYASQLKMMTNPKWARKIKSVAPQGSSYVATVEGKLEATVSGPDKKPHALVLLTFAKDTWQKVGKTWQMTTSTVNKRTATIDGKPMKMG